MAHGEPSELITPISEILMQRRSMTNAILAQAGLISESGQADESPRRPGERGRGSGPKPRRTWIGEPKSAVWMVLAAVILIGGTRRLHWAWRARKAVARLGDADATLEQIEEVAEFGRAGAWELLRIFSSAESEPRRLAAGRTLARLWRDDQLVAEEEQAVLRRGYSVTWKAGSVTHGRFMPPSPLR